MKLLVRIIALALLAAFALVWLWACVAGIGYGVGLAWALPIVAVLLWQRLIWLLQIAALFGAIAVWHLPIVLALILAVPHLFLMLPGAASTWLANLRHPRVRWTL